MPCAARWQSLRENASIRENHPHRSQFLGIRIAALCRLGSRFDSRLNGHGPFFGNHCNQPELVRRIGLRSLVRSDESRVGVEWIHRDLNV